MKNLSGHRRPRGRPRGFDRDEALEIAMRLFWRSGFEATSISELASAMGINPPSLYAAFGDKKALFQEALDRYQNGVGGFAVAALENEPTARGAIETMLRGAINMFTDPQCQRGCMIVLSATNCSETSRDVMEALRTRRHASQSRIRARIEQAIGGELPLGVNADALACYYTTVIEGLSIQARDGASADELGAVVDLAMAAWPIGNASS